MPWHYVPEVDAFTIYHKVQEEEHPPDHDFTFSNALGHAIAGGAGSAVSNVLVYPLALVVTRLQAQHKQAPHARDPEKTDKTQPSPPPSAQEQEEHYTGLLDAFRKIAASGGLPAFYGGVAQDTLKSMAEAFLFFLSYNALYSARARHRAASTSEPSALARALDDVGVGMAAGALTKGLTAPLQQVVARKQRASSSSSSDRESAADILARIRARDGLAGLWSGYGASLILTLNPSLAMSVHSALERAFVAEGGTPGAALTFLFAATSKAVASCAMYPVSLAKTRAQTGAGAGGGGGPLGVVWAIARIAREEGVGALYSGVGGEVLKGFFSHGTTMLVKSRIQRVVVALYFWLLEMLRGRRRSA